MIEKLFETLEENLKSLVEKLQYYEKYGDLFIPLELKMILKVKIFNDRFAFEETLHFLIEDEYDLEIQQYWEQAEPIKCKIKDLPKNHPAYGWLESFAQGSNSLDIEFTHVEFSKSRFEIMDSNVSTPVISAFDFIINPQIDCNVDAKILERYAVKEINPNFYGKIKIEGDASGGATCFESKVDGVIPVRVSITPPSAYL